MKVISKFQDFYDYCGMQSDVLYFRKEEKVTIKVKRNDAAQIYAAFPWLFKSFWFDNKISKKVLLICGKPYYFCLKEVRIPHRQGILFGYTDTNELYLPEDEYLKSNMKPKDFKWHSDKPVPFTLPDVKYWHRLAKSPILEIKLSDLWGYKETELIEITVVKDVSINFLQEILPPADELFRDIEFFISNDLRDEKPLTEIANDYKILASGFDLKTSFRKGKET